RNILAAWRMGMWAVLDSKFGSTMCDPGTYGKVFLWARARHQFDPHPNPRAAGIPPLPEREAGEQMVTLEPARQCKPIEEMPERLLAEFLGHLKEDEIPENPTLLVVPVGTEKSAYRGCLF